MHIKFFLSLLTAAIIWLAFGFTGQVDVSHCYAGFRDCIAECSAAAPGSGGGAASYDCPKSCNESNDAISSRGEECVKQEQAQTENEEQGEQIKDSPTEELPSENISPPPQVTVKRLVAGLDIREGKTITAKPGEILFVDFRGGSFVEVNSGASLTYKEKKDETAFDVVKGSLRFVFEAATGTGRKVE